MHLSRNTSYYNGGLIHLGNVSNVYLGGGSIGYVLQSLTVQVTYLGCLGTISANISNATGAFGVITTSVSNFFTSGLRVTITDVGGMTQLNGNSYYVKVLSFCSLYTDSGLCSVMVQHILRRLRW